MTTILNRWAYVLKMSPMYVIPANDPRYLVQEPRGRAMTLVGHIVNPAAVVREILPQVVHIDGAQVKFETGHRGEPGINALNKGPGPLELSIKHMGVNEQPKGADRAHIQLNNVLNPQI
jgi:hypothetical protein